MRLWLRLKLRLKDVRMVGWFECERDSSKRVDVRLVRTGEMNIIMRLS